MVNGATRVSLMTSMSQPEMPLTPIRLPRTTLSTVPPRPTTRLPLLRLLLMPLRPPPLVLPSLRPLPSSLPPHTLTDLLSVLLRPPTVPPSKLRRLPSMPTSRLSMTKLPMTSLRPEQRDLDAATAAKAAADANLAANDARVAWEKDQLERGQNQDRLKHVNENTSAKTSEIQGKHDERERANGRLLKALASF